MALTKQSNATNGGNILSRLCNCGNTKRPSRPGKCGSVEVESSVKHPDLAIYSQQEIMLNGGTPSWNSPDIITNDWGPFRLKPESSIKVRNISPTVAAINSQVHFFTSPFGIGTRKTLKLTRVISIGAGQEIELNFPLDQQTLKEDQRVGVHILLEHPHDEALLNNFGSQVHDGSYTSESGRHFTLEIPVVNDAPITRQIQLQIMPTDLLATISPMNHSFGPNEQIIAVLTVTVPAFLSGTPGNVINRDVTVLGKLNTGELIGGVSKLLRIDN